MYGVKGRILSRTLKRLPMKITIEVLLILFFIQKAIYRSYSVIRRTVFFKKFLISTKITGKVWVRLISEYFPETIFFITLTGTISSK